MNQCQDNCCNELKYTKNKVTKILYLLGDIGFILSFCDDEILLATVGSCDSSTNSCGEVTFFFSVGEPESAGEIIIAAASAITNAEKWQNEANPYPLTWAS